MMTCQQLTTVCIFMTTYQIAPAQRALNSLVIPGQSGLLNYNLLPRPPKGYHFEPYGYILNNYPSKSYTIKYGLSNNIRNNNRGNSARRGTGSNRKPTRKKKPKNPSSEDPSFSEQPANSTGDPPTAEPAQTSPPDPTA
ncbi:unnamed protein product [Aphis gossypii]|uniref:Uncharacterized protein n=1 Tax=Aphis gossypii TaxID=80765 RepID=A0A9P0IZA9_APHGO|nr:unnamed protein product [Aphis gossypii]